MTDTLLTETLSDWAEEVRTPHDLADRALGRRAGRQTRRLPVLAGLATGALVVGAVAVGGWPSDSQPTVPTPATRNLDVRVDTEQSPPTHLVAAGRVAVSAIVTMAMQPSTDGDWQTVGRHWSVYDPGTETYRPTDWSWVDVAPGLERAAVLEGELPSSRVGIVDLATGEVTRWVELDHPVASLVWSPDGTKVLATAYDADPDRFRDLGDNSRTSPPVVRTGFVLVDVQDGSATFRGVAQPDWPGRADFGWSHDATRVWEPQAGEQRMTFYDLDGRPAAGEDVSTYDENLGHLAAGFPTTSPDGRLKMSRQSGLPTSIIEQETGRTYRQPALQLLAWADDEHVITLAGCADPCEGKGEFRNGLVLMRYDGSDPVPLTMTRKDDEFRWYPVLTRRWLD